MIFQGTILGQVTLTSVKTQDPFGKKQLLWWAFMRQMEAQSLGLLQTPKAPWDADRKGSILQHTSSLFPSGSSTNTITSPCPALMVSTVNLAGCFTMFPVSSIPVTGLHKHITSWARPQHRLSPIMSPSGIWEMGSSSATVTWETATNCDEDNQTGQNP